MKIGYFDHYGGTFAPETLMRSVRELSQAYAHFSQDAAFQETLSKLLKHFVGRPTPITFAQRLTQVCQGAKIYLKREDLAHTGAHKINNTLGQALLAQKMGKKRIIAETGAGQHGVATATACALLGLKCQIYMGAVDVARQALNVKRMQLLGARVTAVHTGTRTLKDAINEAMRDWASHVESYYLIGSVLGPHPYPTIVRDFQTIIGREARQQMVEITQRLPDVLIACVGGGSNAIGLFHPFLNDPEIKMIGVEAGGKGIASHAHAARFAEGSVGIFHGTKTYVLQDHAGQISETHSISAGMDYPAVGPEHAALHDSGRVYYAHVTDDEALEAAHTVSKLEGIVPALESAHALAQALKTASQMSADQTILVNLSGRGDKDLETLSQATTQEDTP